MKVDEALALLGLSYGRHKPIEIDKAHFKPKRRKGTLSAKEPEPKPDHASKSLPIENPVPISDAIEVWDTLVFGWEYLSESEVNEFSVKKLCSIRAQRLLENRASEFSAVVDADFPNRVQYAWDEREAFGDIDALISMEHLKAAERDELVSEAITRARIARARFRAIYINPTLLWVEGSYLEERAGRRLHSCSADDIYRPKVDDRDYYYIFEEGAGKDYYRLRYPLEIEDRLFRISGMYGWCGIVNALRLIILHAGIGFDEYGRILDSSLSSLELSRDDICEIADSIIESQLSYPKLPFGTSSSRRLSINGKRCAPIGMIPRRQREELMGSRSVLDERFSNEEEFRKALAESWVKNRWSYFSGAREESRRKTTENMLRAICELDGEEPKGLGIGKEALSPIDEAHDCLMREPEHMVPSSSFEERKEIVDEFDGYKHSMKKHEDVYNQWSYRQYNSGFDTIKSTLSNFAGAALLTLLVFGLPEAFVIAVLTNGSIDLLGNQFWCLLIATALFIGLLASIWEFLSWPINVWWDRRIQGISKNARWAFELQTLGSSLIAAAIGACVGCIAFGLIVALTRSYSLGSFEAMRIATVAFAIITFLVVLMLHHPGDWRSIFERKYKDDDAVRSGWEEQIANYVIDKYPNLEIETNNRSIIRSQDRFFGHYEIDIWIPDLKLGIEANGEQYHDHDEYNRDVRNGTENSREMYKEKFCEDKGIRLVHVWSSESMDRIQETIDYEIRKRMD